MNNLLAKCKEKTKEKDYIYWTKNENEKMEGIIKLYNEIDQKLKKLLEFSSKVHNYDKNTSHS